MQGPVVTDPGSAYNSAVLLRVTICLSALLLCSCQVAQQKSAFLGANGTSAAGDWAVAAGLTATMDITAGRQLTTDELYAVMLSMRSPVRNMTLYLRLRSTADAFRILHGDDGLNEIIAAGALRDVSSRHGHPRLRTGRYRIQIVRAFNNMEDSGQPSSVEVVGLRLDEIEDWLDYSVEEYFARDSTRRKKARKRILTFRENDQPTAELLARDPIWSEWEAAGVIGVFVFADLPRTSRSVSDSAEMNPANDSRRLALSLVQGHWRSNHLRLQLSENGLAIESIPAPSLDGSRRR